MIRTLLKPLSFIPAILLMIMIYQFSAQPGDVSSQLSYKVSYKIVETADYVFETNLDYWQMDEWANRIHVVTRKLAHMTEYFALAIAVSFPLYVYGVHGIWLMLLAGIICVGFAAGDEYHQSFVSGRSPSVRDVGIDSFGVFWGIILVRIIGWTGRKTIFRPRKKKMKTKKVKQYSRHTKYEDNNMEEDLPPYYPGREYPPYPAQPPYDSRPPYPEQPPYSRGSAYQNGPSYPNQNQRSWQGQQPYPNWPPYPEQPYQGSPYQGQPPYDGPTPMGPQEDPDNYEPYDDSYDPVVEEAPDTEHNKEPFFMKSAYDGKQKPYDPKDPFQDWMDDYFPKDEDTKS